MGVEYVITNIQLQIQSNITYNKFDMVKLFQVTVSRFKPINRLLKWQNKCITI